jgi:hypothetical protein
MEVGLELISTTSISNQPPWPRPAQQQSIDYDTVSTFVKLDGSRSTTRGTTRSFTSLRAHTHTSAGATHGRLSNIEISVAGIQEEVLGLKASINELALWLKQQGTNPPLPKWPENAHTSTSAGITNSCLSTMANRPGKAQRITDSSAGGGHTGADL